MLLTSCSGQQPEKASRFTQLTVLVRHRRRLSTNAANQVPPVHFWQSWTDLPAISWTKRVSSLWLSAAHSETAVTAAMITII